MKIQTNSAILFVARTALSLVIISCLGTLVGCATNQAQQADTMSQERFRYLYPREYYQNASPAERQELDRQEAEEAWEERSTR